MRSLFPDGHVWPDEHSPEDKQAERLKAGLLLAYALAAESAFSHGVDLPVGAVAIRGDAILGGGYASDRRFRRRELHAERMATEDVSLGRRKDHKTVITTLEPCNDCQDYLAGMPSVRTVAFSLPRTAAEERGLVRPAMENIADRTARLGHHYDVIQIDDQVLYDLGLTILDHVSRDPIEEAVSVDQLSLQRELAATPLAEPTRFSFAFSL